MKIKKIAFVTFVSMMVMLTSTSFARNDHKNIEAVFLYNLINYIFWPESKQPPHVFNICLVGNPYIENSFREIQKKAKERKQVLNVYNLTGDNLKSIEEKKCHILYFSQASLQKRSYNIDKFHKANTLTVSGADGFGNIGAVELALVDGKLKLVINIKKVKQAGLSVSSKLLRLSKVVDE